MDAIAEHVLKQIPEDFLVKEAMVLAITDASQERRGDYALLTKKGFTTFEAVAELARFLQIPSERITYAGLKDEDAITEQSISVEAGIDQDRINAFNERFRPLDGPFIRLTSTGLSGPPLKIGRLIGNSFCVTARRVSKPLGERLATRKHFDMLTINYYDVQRFGVANGPKLTHKIGEALEKGDHARAFELLAVSESHEGRLARESNSTPADFFGSLDRRIVQFYYAAYASACWNERVMQTLAHTSEAPPLESSRQGLKYLFAGQEADVLELLKAAPSLPMTRYALSAAPPEVTTDLRPTTVNVRFNVRELRQDDLHPGYVACALEFFLPSGCYATLAVDQLMRFAGAPAFVQNGRFSHASN
jgi:tRNA pseudouridine13 synthase